MPMKGNFIQKEWEKSVVLSDQPLPASGGTAEGVGTSTIQTGASTGNTADACLQRTEGTSIRDNKNYHFLSILVLKINSKVTQNVIGAIRWVLAPRSVYENFAKRYVSPR